MSDTIVLTGAFDPASLKPGQTYAAISDNEAYPILHYMVTAGFAETIWEQFLDGGRVALTAKVAGRVNPESEGDVEASGRMTLTPKWARDNVLKDYVVWQEAWWREAVQNSVDAGATRIELTAEEQADGTVLVACDDNGRGMTQEQMEHPEEGFLRFGGTTKSGIEGTGAFGKAKELLVLPWIRWTVMTKDKRYDGVMDQWKRRASPMRQGLRLEVVMPGDFCTNKSTAMAFLEKCWLPQVEFVLNGRRVTTKMPTPTDPDDVIERHSMGVIYRYKRERISQEGSAATLRAFIYVRKNGIWMFSIPLPHNARESVLVEVTADSKVAFNQSRDAFNYHSLHSKLEDLKAELTIEKKVLTRRDKMEAETFPGADHSMTAERAAKLQLALGTLPEIGAHGARFDNKALEVIRSVLAGFASEDAAAGVHLGTTEPTAGTEMCRNVNVNGQKKLDFLIKQLVWPQDFRIVKYPKQPVVPKRFYPGSMTPQIYRLARVWSELCRFVLIMLGSTQEYGIGWVFTSEDLAVCEYTNKQSYLLLNPYHLGRVGNPIYNPSDDGDLKKLYALALHECTHMYDGVSKHDDSYAAALSKNIAICAVGVRELRAVIGGLKTRSAPKVDNERRPRGSRQAQLKLRAGLRAAMRIRDGFGIEEDRKAFLDGIRALGAQLSPKHIQIAKDHGKTPIAYATDRFSIDGKIDLDRALLWYMSGPFPKFRLRADGSTAIRIWNELRANTQNDPEVKFWMEEAQLTYPDWDADALDDMGESEYTVAKRAADLMSSVVAHLDSENPLSTKLLYNAELLAKTGRLTRWQEDVGMLAQILDPSLSSGEVPMELVQQISNTLAITRTLYCPSFTLSMTGRAQGSYDGSSRVLLDMRCAFPFTARRFDLCRRADTYEYLYVYGTSAIDPMVQNNVIPKFPPLSQLAKGLNALAALAGASGAVYHYTRKLEGYPEQPGSNFVAKLDALSEYLGYGSDPEWASVMAPLLFDQGVCMMIGGDELYASRQKSDSDPTFRLVPASARSAELWRGLRDSLPHLRRHVPYVGGIELDDGSAMQIAASSAG